MRWEFLKEKRVPLAAACGALFIVAAVFFSILPPFSFPSGSIVTISEGMGLHSLSEKLKADGVIRSSFWFRIFAIAMGGERDMKAGQYYMTDSENSLSVARRIFQGRYDIESVRVTIPEGFTAAKIAALFDERFANFDQAAFLASAPEGYLFPDTYFLPVTATNEAVSKILQDNFERRLKPLIDEVEESGRTLEEIIIMASILEGEAREREDMEIVSGILWRRIEMKMPLQVDATFAYINGKTTKDLTLDDLKIDSPFNTYLYRGLPPSPISNPGLESIRAALYPVESPYLYFLTGDDRKMHYSRTHDEHVEKKAKYIRNGR